MRMPSSRLCRLYPQIFMRVEMLMTNGVSLCEGKKGCVSVITLLQSGVKGGRSAGGGEGSSLQIYWLLHKHSFSFILVLLTCRHSSSSAITRLHQPLTGFCSGKPRLPPSPRWEETPRSPHHKECEKIESVQNVQSVLSPHIISVSLLITKRIKVWHDLPGGSPSCHRFGFQLEPC